MNDNHFRVTVQPGIQVWRCTEAIDPRAGGTFRTIGHADGRCVEIISSQNTMLFDRHLARAIALAILEIAGPEEVLDGDVPELVEVVYDDAGRTPVGFRPYQPSLPSMQAEQAEWLRTVRAETADKEKTA